LKFENVQWKSIKSIVRSVIQNSLSAALGGYSYVALSCDFLNIKYTLELVRSCCRPNELQSD